MSETTAVLSEPQPGPGRRGTRGLVAIGASVLAVVLIAVGGFAVWQFFFSAGGPRPAEVLPDSTFALVTVDLDPSGGQKIEAIQTMRKFPSLKKRIGASAEDDLMKVVVEGALQDSPCKSLDYESDLKPWIGSRAGLGGVLLGDDKPVPVLVLQVNDAERAKPGFAKLTKCAKADDGDDFGWTVSDDYVVASDTTSHAEAIVSAGENSPLSSDSDFQKWTDEAGGPGIMNAYFGRNGVDVLSDQLGPGSGGLMGGLMGGGLGGDTGMDPSLEYEKPSEGAGNDMTEVMKDFKGAAAGLRFADGGIELSLAGGESKQSGTARVGDHVGSLPGDTAAVLAVGVPDDALDGLGDDAGRKGSPFSLEEFLAETGLDIPEDLIDLLGSSLSISLGADAPENLENVSGPGDLPLGALIHGDEDKIRRAIEKVETRTGRRLSDLSATVSSGEGKVSIATTSDYGDLLLADGSLAETKNYADVVENADNAQGVLYLSFENGWMDAVQEMLGAQDDAEANEISDNLAVLRALGASGWREGGTSHAKVRLALK